MSCASVVSRRLEDADVTVLEAGGHISFAACGMPYWLGDEIPGDEDELVVVSPEEARNERGIDVRTETRVTRVDPQARTVTFETADGQGSLSYDRLVLAPGVEALDPFGCSQLANVITLRHLDDGIEAKALLEEHEPETACVVGGGFVGIETAEALNRRGIETTIVQSSDTLLDRMLVPELGEKLNERVQAAGIDLETNARAQDVLSENGRARAVELPEGEVSGDLVVVAVGARPRTELAQEAGCRVGDHGGVVVDEAMRTGVDDVLACGDCVAYPHKVTGDDVVMPLALHANRSGRIAGETLADNEAAFPGVLGTAVTRFEDLEIAATGLTVEEAEQAGFEATAATIESVTRAGYHPDADPIHVRLVAEQSTGRLLGGQILGGPGSGKRIDTVASAVWMGATCEDIEGMDLAYAPPVSPTWDPVAIAARITGRGVDG